MITKMNYLLLSTMMIAVIDSTFGSCCPCGKEEENINDQNNENNNKVDKISDENITKKTFTNSKINDNGTVDLIDNENLEYKNENIDNQNTRNNGKKNKKKKKKGKNTNGDGIKNENEKKESDKGDGIKNENEKKESDKGVEKLLLQNVFPQTDNKIVGDNQEIEGIFENARKIFRQNKIHNCKYCNNQNNQKTIGFCAFNTNRTARKKYAGFSIRICPNKGCEVLHRCKQNPTVLLACGHVACRKCIELLCFCKQCKGYYCQNPRGCNNHTLCDRCCKIYICNNITGTAHQNKCPSCANSK